MLDPCPASAQNADRRPGVRDGDVVSVGNATDRSIARRRPSPATRSAAARVAANTRWSRADAAARYRNTANAREAFYASFEDPSVADPAERSRRARNALAAHMARLQLAQRRKSTDRRRR